MDWQPIETYDAMPLAKRRKFTAVFYVKATEPLPHRTDFMRGMVVLDRQFGSRVTTHWFQLPPLPVQP